MRKVALALVAIGLCCRIAGACFPWPVLRAGFSPLLWQPFVKSIPDALPTKHRPAKGGPFAGMGSPGQAEVAAARSAYQALARWREEHWGVVSLEPSNVDRVVSKARHAVATALATHTTGETAEELGLLKAKVTLREAELLLVLSRGETTASATSAQDTLRKARDELLDFLSRGRNPAYRSEARGWLGRCYYLQGEPHRAARLYLDELSRTDSVIERDTLLASLRIIFPYNGSAARLADHLDEYFDSPEHALFVINLATNPILEDKNERRAMGLVGRKALEALESHRELFSTSGASDELALAAMRAGLYMGDPAKALTIYASLPHDSAVQAAPEARWMSGVAHFLLGQYEPAEGDLAAVAESAKVSERQRGLARLGLLAVYQRLGRPVDELLTAFVYDAARTVDDTNEASQDWYVSWWPYEGFLMDLSYLLEIRLSEEELRSARSVLQTRKPLTVHRWTSAGERDLTAIYLIDYELAVRAARRESYSEAAEAYERLGVQNRADRMRALGRLYNATQADSPLEERLRSRYEYAVFLADRSERVFFNDLLWERLQRYAFLDQEPRPEPASTMLTPEERRTLSEKERQFKDSQEERWRAFKVLEGVVGEGGHSALGDRAARKAIECLDRISIDRFGREEEIAASKNRLVASLHRQ